jgi:hypothetical protein
MALAAATQEVSLRPSARAQSALLASHLDRNCRWNPHSHTRTRSCHHLALPDRFPKSGRWPGHNSVQSSSMACLVKRGHVSFSRDHEGGEGRVWMSVSTERATRRAGQWLRRLITLVFAGWLPHFISSSRGCLGLMSGIIAWDAHAELSRIPLIVPAHRVAGSVLVSGEVVRW